ncbi:DUF7536 family protein [Salinibaculum salinum]|uniref:DUF7536 family protein n=1 Tax=Salinibaculum salinum TaxID=3131996 RepID=UPI0030EC0C89
MSSTEDQPSGRAALVEALHVRQNLKRGVVLGIAFTAAIFLFFVVLAPNTVRPPVYYVALAFVLAMTSSGLAAALLVMRRAYKLTREL